MNGEAKEAYPAWARPAGEVLSHFNVDLAAGLSEAAVAKARLRHGYNELDKPPSTPLWKLVLAQFDDTLVKVRQEPPRRRRQQLCMWRRRRRFRHLIHSRVLPAS